MIEVEFYCDEAGRLGYADSPEKYRGEFTLVAGLIVFGGVRNEVVRFCDYLSDRYRFLEEGGKFHVTDMGEGQALIREDVLSFIKMHDIPLVYGANYFQPLYLKYLELKESIESAVVNMKKQGVGLSSNLSRFTMNAQVEAFFYFYSKAMGFSLHVLNRPLLGLVKTDRIDGMLFDEYLRSIERCHNINSRGVLKGRHYHFETLEVRNFGVDVNVNIDAGDFRYKLLRDSSGRVEIVDSGLSILADVVTNSLNHHLKRYVLESDCGPLNGHEAIKGYFLASQVCVAGDKSIDLIYPYPKT